MSSVRLIWITPDAEKLIAYCARVSSPNQENPEYEGLLKYCLKKQHWSIFEMASACLEVETTRSIAPQILRHRSFSFQEFSQRYAEVDAEAFELPAARRQDTKNRQASHDDLGDDDKKWYVGAAYNTWRTAHDTYKEALKRGIAKECARQLLPGMAQTTIYMAGTIRSFITYFMVRCAEGVQKEHRDLAVKARDILKVELPTIGKACGW
jgi:thymidylate synthase (FAD)